jgi:hypothetical protein
MYCTQYYWHRWLCCVDYKLTVPPPPTLLVHRIYLLYLLSSVSPQILFPLLTRAVKLLAHFRLFSFLKKLLCSSARRCSLNPNYYYSLHPIYAPILQLSFSKFFGFVHVYVVPCFCSPLPPNPSSRTIRRLVRNMNISSPAYHARYPCYSG